MNYENAKDILPEELLKQVQKYAGGKFIYVPVDSSGKAWGEASGYRKQLQRRNVMIFNKYKNGMTLSELADEYCLSLDSIKKIVYCKKEKELVFVPSIASAVRYANAGLTEEWIKTYYDIHDKSQYNQLDNIISIGILRIPLRLIRTDMLQETEEQVKVTDGIDFEEMEPLIVSYEEKKFYVKHQKHLLANLKRSKVNAYPAFIIVTKKEEYKTFMANYGRHFIPVS